MPHILSLSTALFFHESDNGRAFACGYRKSTEKRLKKIKMIRKFEERDAGEVSALIAKTLRVTNSRDYSPDYIEKEVALMTPDFFD